MDTGSLRPARGRPHAAHPAGGVGAPGFPATNPGDYWAARRIPERHQQRLRGLGDVVEVLEHLSKRFGDQRLLDAGLAIKEAGPELALALYTLDLRSRAMRSAPRVVSRTAARSRPEGSQWVEAIRRRVRRGRAAARRSRRRHPPRP